MFKVRWKTWDESCCKFTAESNSEENFKIGQYFSNIMSGTFLWLTVYLHHVPSMSRCLSPWPVSTSTFYSLSMSTERISMKFWGGNHYHQKMNTFCQINWPTYSRRKWDYDAGRFVWRVTVSISAQRLRYRRIRCRHRVLESQRCGGQRPRPSCHSVVKLANENWDAVWVNLACWRSINYNIDLTICLSIVQSAAFTPAAAAAPCK